jgi:diacylglycerol kinase family enzyme
VQASTRDASVRAHDGTPAVRHFVNVASFGFSSAVASRANASSKRLGGKLAFLAATVRAIVSYDNTDVWLTLDQGERQRRRVLLAAVGNGRYRRRHEDLPRRRARQRIAGGVVVGDFSRGEVIGASVASTTAPPRSRGRQQRPRAP